MNRVVLASGLFLAGFLASAATAAQVTYDFSGNVVATGSSNPGLPEFGAFANALAITGSVQVNTGALDAAPDSTSHGVFNGVPLIISVSIPGVGAWSSSTSGLVETWNNQPDVYPFGDALSFVGGGDGSLAGSAFGNNFFTSMQVTFVDDSPLASPNMLTSDDVPGALSHWDKGFLYLNFNNYTDGPPYTTMRVEFSSLSVSPVPEPSTFALLGLGAIGLWLQRRRSVKA
jgi:hypothetical protein